MSKIDKIGAEGKNEFSACFFDHVDHKAQSTLDIKASMFISRQAQSFPEVDLLTQSSHGKFDTKTS